MSISADSERFTSSIPGALILAPSSFRRAGITPRGAVLVPGVEAFARIAGMKSKLAAQSKRSLLEANQRLTPAQRLDAYVIHSRLMFDLYQSGLGMRVKLARLGK